MRGEKVQHPGRKIRLPGDGGLRQFGIEARRFRERRPGDMVGVRVNPVGREYDLRPHPADHLGHQHAIIYCINQIAVGHLQRDAGDAQDARGVGRLAGAAFRRADGRRLPVGEIADGHLVALGPQREDRPAHADLDVVGVRTNRKDLHRVPHTKLSRSGSHRATSPSSTLR